MSMYRFKNLSIPKHANINKAPPMHDRAKYLKPKIKRKP